VKFNGRYRIPNLVLTVRLAFLVLLTSVHLRFAMVLDLGRNEEPS